MPENDSLKLLCLLSYLRELNHQDQEKKVALTHR